MHHRAYCVITNCSKEFLKKYNKTEKVCKKTKQLINQYIAPNKDLKVVSYKMGLKKINT